MMEQNQTTLKRKRMDYTNLQGSKLFRKFVESLIEKLEGRCCYCGLILYADEEWPYAHPDSWYEEGGPCFGLPKTFIERTWDYHIDHIIPLSKGGSNDFDNLTLACPRCNCSKGAKLQWQP